jgi:hypothetical protein
MMKFSILPTRTEVSEWGNATGTAADRQSNNIRPGPRRERFCGISLPKNGFGLKFGADGRNIGQNVKILTISLLHVSPGSAAARRRGK